MAWATVASAALNNDNNGWSNYTVRQVIASAGLSNVGNLNYRVTFTAGTTEGLKIDSAYIGQAADTGDAYDFISTPVQILFSGIASCTIAANGNIVSDSVSANIPVGKNLVISMHFPTDSSNDMIRRLQTKTNWSCYYKSSGDDAATVNATGYSTGYNVMVVSLIESQAGISFIPGAIWF